MSRQVAGQGWRPGCLYSYQWQGTPSHSGNFEIHSLLRVAGPVGDPWVLVIQECTWLPPISCVCEYSGSHTSGWSGGSAPWALLLLVRALGYNTNPSSSYRSDFVLLEESEASQRQKRITNSVVTVFGLLIMSEHGWLYLFFHSFYPVIISDITSQLLYHFMYKYFMVG